MLVPLGEHYTMTFQTLYLFVYRSMLLSKLVFVPCRVGDQSTISIEHMH